MNSIRTFAIYVLASLGLVSQSTAQPAATQAGPGSITVPGTATAGETVEIKVHNPDKAGSTITVNIDNGESGADHRATTVEITLDQDGNGSSGWEVPSWDLANFNTEGATEEVMFIQ